MPPTISDFGVVAMCDPDEQLVGGLLSAFIVADEAVYIGPES
jgi:hypothetical protein